MEINKAAIEYDNNVDRFNNRIDNYARYRPDYPEALFAFLEAALSLNKEMLLADIGSGTGLFSKHLLERGYRLVCVEPNAQMRAYAERSLSGFGKFTSVGAKAEQTGLEGNSVDCIFVAQAFHWMNPAAAKTEFLRILKPGGRIIICWILALQNTTFLYEYERLRQQYSIKTYPAKRNDETVLQGFYEPMAMVKKVFRFTNYLDFNSLKGLILSVSFIPQPGHPAYQNMVDSFLILFNRFNINGYVQMNYELLVYWNR